MIPAAAFAQTITLEADQYEDSYDYFGYVIGSEEAPDCTGGYMLVGLDALGEWTEYTLPVSAFGIYSVSMHCRGLYAHYYTFQLILTAGTSGVVQTIDITFLGLGTSG